MAKPKSPLTVTCVIGLVLALIISWGLVLYGFIWGREAEGQVKTADFTRTLREYDFFDAPGRVLAGENPGEIEKRLAALQKTAGGAENWLSVLKRRRALALLDRRYTAPYADTAREAAELFAYSAPVAAVAVEALLMENPTLPETARSLLKNYAGRISQYRFGNMELGAHILAGNLEDPAPATEIPELVSLLSRELPGLPARDRRDLATDEFLLLAQAGDIPGASLKLNALLSEAAQSGNRADFDGGEYARAGAEFFYDHKNPLRAAELFSRLPGENGVTRAADALVLAGEIPAARNIWLALVSPESAPAAGDSLLTGAPEQNTPAGTAAAPARTPARNFYNLAASSADKREEASWLERSLAGRSREGELRNGQRAPDSTEIFSVIRYTRLLDSSRAAAILGEIKQDPLTDLELLRRKREDLAPARAAAEVWLLLDRHPGEEALHEWAAWYFGTRKLYDETALLLKEAARKGMTGSWVTLRQSLALIHDEKTLEAEKLLRAAAKDTAREKTDWRIPANLGRVLEGRGALSQALEFYEAAAALSEITLPAGKLSAERISKEKKAAALLQMRISRCQEALGLESRRAMETALELDPDNLNIRREFRRFESR